ncbi:hypothetical protein, partial [Falsigemmobacter faecalis]|uniref:hypothetical protein n=1 Tax=Falsigemmobacter faecalis TaxID=2488730 RepID=UPI001F2F35AC
PAYPFIIINVKERDPQTQQQPDKLNFAEPTDRVSTRSKPQPAAVPGCPAAVKGCLDRPAKRCKSENAKKSAISASLQAGPMFQGNFGPVFPSRASVTGGGCFGDKGVGFSGCQFG